MTPEVYKLKRFDFKVDIWALDCVFGYTLSRGKHPFGDDDTTHDDTRRISRIKDNEPMMMLTQEDLKKSSLGIPAFDLLKAMLEVEPTLRPSVEDVLQSILFVYQ